MLAYFNRSDSGVTVDVDSIEEVRDYQVHIVSGGFPNLRKHSVGHVQQNKVAKMDCFSLYEIRYRAALRL